MTQVSAIIKRAYREGNLIAIGAEPSTAQAEEALDRLNALIAALMGFEVGTDLLDWPLGNDNVQGNIDWAEDRWRYVINNARLIPNMASPQTVFLPPEPQDGTRVAVVDPRQLLATYPLTLDGNGRVIEDVTSLTLNTAGLDRQWFYRADLGKWVVVSLLASGDQMPFPLAFDDFFITKLAMRLNPLYGRSMPDASVATLVSMQEKLRARYTQNRDVPADLGAVMMTEGFDRNYRARGIARGRNSWMT
jgi:hypothetical protein